MSVSEQQVETAIKEIVDPNLEQDLVSAKCVKSTNISNGSVSVDVELGYPAKGYIDELTALLKEKIQAIEGVTEAKINISSKIVSHTVQKGVKPIEGVKNIIAIASGKGGVGKSTTAANLALALAREGARVGVLDADIYGPSQGIMFGIAEGTRPEIRDGTAFIPLEAHGVQVMSMAFLSDDKTPMAWRGPLVCGALSQLITQTAWDDLDYLVVDMPPGTGDAQLTMAQQVPLAGAVIVSTPQDLALIDARKGLKMFQNVDVPILGIIENMSSFICPHLGETSDIFGHGGAKDEAIKLAVPFLGAIPLHMDIRKHSDEGKPTVVADPDGPHTKIYKAIALNIAMQLRDDE